MSTHPVKPEIDALLDIARLRTLARHLVADPLAAEDLVQDAWVAALARPAPPRDLGAWLAGAVRHLARRARRGSERRTRREEVSARAEVVPSTLELSERSELLERLIAAVRALDEPYRTTVLLHYVEGWTLERIARREEVPSSTVRNRLARALERLREQLDRETRGDRSVWLAALAPFARLPDPAGSSLTTFLMGTTSKLVLSTAAAGGALLAFLVPAPAGAGETVVVPVVAREPGAARDARAGVSEQIARPAAVSSRAPLAPGESDRAGRLVYGTLAGAGGETSTEGQVSFTDGLGEEHEATLGAGAYSIVGLAPGAWSVRADCAGFLPRSEELVLEPGRDSTRLDLVLQRSTVVRVKFLDEQGQTIVDATSDRFDAPFLAAIATRERPGSRISGVHARMPAHFGAGVYRSPVTFRPLEGLPQDCAGLLELRAPLPLWISAVLRDRVLESRLEDGRADEVVFVLDRAALDGQHGGLRARLVDAESGAPLSGTAALQYVDMSGGGPAIQPDGTIEFLDEVAGLRQLELRAVGHERFQRTVRLRPGEMIDLGTIALHGERSIAGHLSDEDGEPVATALNWTPAALVASALDVYQRVSAESGPDGSFKLFGTGRGEVLLFAGRGEYAANPIRIPPGDDVEVDEVVPRGTLVVIRPRQHDGPGALFAVADERGRLFWTGKVWGDRPLRLRLVLGTYQLWTGRDEEVERVESFTVGGETLVLDR